MFFPMSGWFAAFVLTIAVEVPIAIILLRAAEPRPVRAGGLAIFANLATHPVVWYVMTQLFLVGTVAYVVASEIWAVAIEAVLYRVAIVDLSWGRAALVAVAANAVSFALGRLVAQLAPDLLR
jgi:hypothetical protein